jgi:hypothetical protein
VSNETLFTLCSNAVLPGWILLLLAPRWRWTTSLIASVLIPGLLAIVYVTLMAANFGSAKGGFSSLAEVAQLMSHPRVLLAGWVHYLVFDLFIGCWEVRDAQQIGLRHWWVVPCLVLTLLLGPTGLLLYFIIRGAVKRRFLIEPAYADQEALP